MYFYRDAVSWNVIKDMSVLRQKLAPHAIYHHHARKHRVRREWCVLHFLYLLVNSQLLSVSVKTLLPIFGSDFPCSSDVMICNNQTEACTEVFEDGRFLTLTCNIVNCTESSCPSNRECTEIPDDLVQELEIQFRHSCSLPGFVYSETCASAASLCPLGLACHDVVFEETTIDIRRGVSAPTYSGLSCEELACPAPLECYESIVEGKGGLAQCVPDESLDIIIEEISHTTG